MKLRVLGECKRCGGCCLLMCKSKFMLNEQGVCRFLEPDGLCAIRAKRVVPTDEQLHYYLKNCVPFPFMVEDQDPKRVLEYFEKVGWPTKRCGYQVRVDYG